MLQEGTETKRVTVIHIQQDRGRNHRVSKIPFFVWKGPRDEDKQGRLLSPQFPISQQVRKEDKGCQAQAPWILISFLNGFPPPLITFLLCKTKLQLYNITFKVISVLTLSG